jgi:glutamine amidotransferase
MITIIDSGIANIGSVLSACRRIGVATAVTTDAVVVRSARALILPGVGAFRDGMESLERHRLVDAIHAAAHAGTPILGICLGMQLLADSSDEFGDRAGLGLIPGRVEKLETAKPEERVPNIGWCDVYPSGTALLFVGFEASTPLYFVHSYHLRCREATDSAATIRFGGANVTVSVQRKNIFGVQFHPEKSQDAGLGILAAFANYVQSA